MEERFERMWMWLPGVKGSSDKAGILGFTLNRNDVRLFVIYSKEQGIRLLNTHEECFKDEKESKVTLCSEITRCTLPFTSKNSYIEVSGAGAFFILRALEKASDILGSHISYTYLLRKGPRIDAWLMPKEHQKILGFSPDGIISIVGNSDDASDDSVFILYSQQHVHAILEDCYWLENEELKEYCLKLSNTILPITSKRKMVNLSGVIARTITIGLKFLRKESTPKHFSFIDIKDFN